MGQLTLASIVFVAAHLGVSSTPLRAALVRAIGDRAYLGVYSLLAAVTLIWLIIALQPRFARRISVAADALGALDPVLGYADRLYVPVGRIHGA